MLCKNPNKKVLLIRENLTSFKDAMIVRNEQKENLRNALIILSTKLRNNEPITIRVNAHSTLKALAHDKNLEHLTSKNPNKTRLQRDQQSLEFSDTQIWDIQYKMRLKSHETSAKFQSRNAPTVKLTDLRIGDRVYVKTDAV